MEQFEHDRNAAALYLQGQLQVGPDAIDHVELIQREWVGVDEYLIWDCHTVADGRWWVIAPFMNLYSQDDFKSADYMLSFHIGLAERVRWKRDGPPQIAKGMEGIEALFRQVEDAGFQADQAVEVAEVRGAAVSCREALVTLGVEIANLKREVADRCVDVQKGNFVERAEIAAEVLASGSREKHLRAHLKKSAAVAWRYTNWLTHDSKGMPGEAQFAQDLTQRVVLDFVSIALEDQRPDPLECPQCRSRRVAFDSSYGEEQIESWRVCEKCDWRSESEFSEYPPRVLESLEPDAGLDTPCTPTGDGPGK